MSWACGGVPMGRVMIKAMEYLKDDLILYGDDAVSFGVGVRREFAKAEVVKSLLERLVERGMEVRGKEKERGW